MNCAIYFRKREKIFRMYLTIPTKEEEENKQKSIVEMGNNCSMNMNFHVANK